MRKAVAIDGPAGAGKSTIAKLVGKEFDLMYINTGAMYRAVTLKAKEKDISVNDIEELCALIEDLEMRFEDDDLIVNGENIQEKLTNPEITSVVSAYASIPKVREKLVALQRKMSDRYEVIMDGRDIGTVVLKEAPYKFFLTATPEERADRRYKELINKDIKVDYDEILRDIIRRDYEDSNRKIDPLKQADDAILVDTTGLNIQEVTNKIVELIKKN